MSDALARIDDTLTFYSAGLDQEMAVPVENSGLEAVAREALENFAADLTASLKTAFARFQAAMVSMWREMQPTLAAAAEFAQVYLNARRRWVFRRWNDPLARAAMWRRKGARALR